ncbi:MAG: CoA transferase, partial [Bauldia sp.]
RAATLHPIFAGRASADWLTALDARGIPCAPINGFDAILADPHVRAMGLLHDLPLPDGSQTRTVGFPVAMTGYTFRVERGPPALGEHTEEVFEEWLETVSQ